VGTLILAAFAPPLTEVAFKFGPAEYFSLMVLGLIGAVVLASGSLIKAIAMIVLGLLLGLVGTDVNSGVARFSFDVPELTDGIGFIVIAMGVFGYGEIISQPVASGGRARGVHRQGAGPDADQGRLQAHGARRAARHALDSAGHPAGRRRAAGRLCGLHHREEDQAASPGEVPFGQGNIRGVAAPESANNAGSQTSFIPLLTLGIPPNAVMALMVGAMTIHNIQPGPQVMTSNPELFWGLIASMWIGNADAGHPEPAADRHVDQAADRALPLAVPGHRAVLRHWRVLHQQQHLGHLDGGGFGVSATASSSWAASPRHCCWASSWGR
jgi:putative tricarboxylic transport membrane protein